MAITYSAGGYNVVMPPITPELRRLFADCDQLEEGPDCEVCDDLGEVLDAPGAHGQPRTPCLNCDAYDRNQQAAEDAAAERRDDR